VDLCNGQQHVVVVSRREQGRIVRIQVDDYPVSEKDFGYLLRSTSDTRLDQPKYLYMGKNESTVVGRGFQGCLHMAQFNNIFPIKLAFQVIVISTTF
jgi:contactin associated protein-like 2